jgi:hypothetical protein
MTDLRTRRTAFDAPCFNTGCTVYYTERGHKLRVFYSAKSAISARAEYNIVTQAY